MNGATTVGGCVIKHMSCIPKEGDRLIIAGRVLVVEKDGPQPRFLHPSVASGEKGG